MTSKPKGYVETNHLMEIKDKTEMSYHIWKSFRNLYGRCYENIEVDERTGEIYGINDYDFEHEIKDC